MGDLLLVTGDGSSDRYAARLVEYLQDRGFPGTIHAAAGHQTGEAGAHLVENLVDRGVVGITEAAGSLFYFVSLLRRLDDLLVEHPVRAVVLLDFPGFNLQLLARWIRFRKFDIPLYYYIPPQVWAWRKGRIRKLRKWFEELFVIFPFEEDFYDQHGVRARFVGHPMLENRPEQPPFDLRKRLELSRERRIVSFFPGSRNHEIERHLAVMADVAGELKKNDSGLYPILSAAPTVDMRRYERIMGEELMERIPVWSGDSRSLLEASELCVLTSGTVTMEAAFARTPMIVGYRASRLSYWVGKLLVHADSIAMPNLIRPDLEIPELIQSEFNRERLRDTVRRFLTDRVLRQTQREKLEEIVSTFAQKRPSQEVGDRVLAGFRSS